MAGELNVDLVLQGYHKFPTPGEEVLVDGCEMVLGSASAICAMGLARLGNPVSFLGKVGDDAWGRYCLDALRGRGIDVSRVRSEPALKTGITVAITSPRERALVSFLGSINALTPEDVPSPASPASSTSTSLRSTCRTGWAPAPPRSSSARGRRG